MRENHKFKKVSEDCHVFCLLVVLHKITKDSHLQLYDMTVNAPTINNKGVIIATKIKGINK